MADPSNIVRVPKPARTAYNPKRPLAGNTLLKSQVEHLNKLELALPPPQRTGIDPASIQTEGQAAAYIRKITAILHPQAARSGGKA